jgi:hypothetical protein
MPDFLAESWHTSQTSPWLSVIFIHTERIFSLSTGASGMRCAVTPYKQWPCISNDHLYSWLLRHTCTDIKSANYPGRSMSSHFLQTPQYFFDSVHILHKNKNQYLPPKLSPFQLPFLTGSSWQLPDISSIHCNVVFCFFVVLGVEPRVSPMPGKHPASCAMPWALKCTFLKDSILLNCRIHRAYPILQSRTASGISLSLPLGWKQEALRATRARCWWLTPKILATQEAEIRKIKASSGK